MLKFDELSDKRVELRSQLFDQKTEDGVVLKRGMFSEDDIDVFFDQYLSRLPEEMRGAWEEQFKVYKDDFEEFTNPDGTKELKRVIDEEATRANEQKYVMEEVEVESFFGRCWRSPGFRLARMGTRPECSGKTASRSATTGKLTKSCASLCGPKTLPLVD